MVYDDAMGKIWSAHKAKFVRQFANLKGEIREAVRARMFPDLERESYMVIS